MSSAIPPVAWSACLMLAALAPVAHGATRVATPVSPRLHRPTRPSAIPRRWPLWTAWALRCVRSSSSR